VALTTFTRLTVDQVGSLLGIKIVRNSVADDTDLRRVCRQRNHTVCLPCPAVDHLESAGPPTTGKPPPAGRS
jgi:hypothetical protein